MAHKPIKRHVSLQPVSREHHFGLLLCWKIRTGFNLGVNPKRIKKYCDWFYETHLVPHFEFEEQNIFPILSEDAQMINKALLEHRELHQLFNTTENLTDTLATLEEKLEQHIRFEERVLFNKIQEIASPNQLTAVEAAHNTEMFEENRSDEFWKK
ncbi:MAG: hemerythrin domain-containing protein [Fulvivirga sp.]